MNLWDLKRWTSVTTFTFSSLWCSANSYLSELSFKWANYWRVKLCLTLWNSSLFRDFSFLTGVYLPTAFCVRRRALCTWLTGRPQMSLFCELHPETEKKRFCWKEGARLFTFNLGSGIYVDGKQTSPPKSLQWFEHIYGKVPNWCLKGKSPAFHVMFSTGTHRPRPMSLSGDWLRCSSREWVMCRSKRLVQWVWSQAQTKKKPQELTPEKKGFSMTPPNEQTLEDV